MMLSMDVRCLPSNRQVACQAPMRFAGRRISLVAAAADNPNRSDPDMQSGGRGHPNDQPLPFYNGHQLPWEGYISNIFHAIEAEADANSAFKEAYSNSFHGDTGTTQPQAACNAASGAVPIEPPNEVGGEAKSKLQQAMEKQDDARRFIWAAEYNANEFFRNMKIRKPITGNMGEAGVPISTNSAQLVGSHFTDVQAAMQQGADYARQQWLLTLQAAQRLLLKSRAALSSTADKVKSGVPLLLVTPLQLGGTSDQRLEQRASLQQLRQLRNDTMRDVASLLARGFRHGMDEHEMHTEEAREWLERLWHMELEDMAVNDKPGNTLPHTPSMQQQSSDAWVVVVGVMAVMSVWPGISQW